MSVPEKRAIATGIFAVLCGAIVPCDARIPNRLPLPQTTGTERLLYSFQDGTDGGFPATGLIPGEHGTFYGTTVYGGTGVCNFVYPGCGTVFRLTPNGSGYRETVVYNFQNRGDGAAPNGLVRSSDGTLYGTTTDYSVPVALFALIPNRHGGFTEKTIYNFGVTEQPWGPLTVAPDGSLFGVTLTFGASPGSVFHLTRSASGYTKTILHSFNGGVDGLEPQAPMLLDSTGTLWDSTSEGGGHGCLGNGCGTLFKLTPAGGNYKETVLYRFTGGNDGAFPSALTGDPHGTLFGTTGHGGIPTCIDGGCGTVFALDRAKRLTTVLYRFGPFDLWSPDASVVVGPDGTLYGTTSEYTPQFDDGGVFALTPTGRGYLERDVHIFQGSPTDGQFPRGGLVMNKAGILFGTTYWGGSSGPGTVYEITP